MKNHIKYLMLALLLASFLIPGCTAPVPPADTTTSTTTTTPPPPPPAFLDASFLNSEVLYRTEVFSPVFDASNYSKLSLLLQCTNNFSWVKLQVSPDGVSWFDQRQYFGEPCRLGVTETVITISKYYRAFAYGIDGRTENITMFGRFYN
jgi:hypothetical protein